jgi:hypothetical protein
VLHELKKTLSLSAALLLTFTGCGSEPAPGIAIRNVTVIDAAHGMRARQTVIFDGDSITYAGPPRVHRKPASRSTRTAST